MSAELAPKRETNNVIRLTLSKGKLCVKPEVRYNKDGSVDRRHPNKVAGKSSEVYPFTSKEEIESMIDVFNKHIEEAPDDDKLWIARRNKLLFLIGINIGLRASDLATLTWNFFYNDDGSYKDFYTLMPKKTKKHKKFVKIFFNQTIKKALENYTKDYPIKDLNGYVFKSREGDSHITSIHLGKIIKDTAKEANIPKNVCSHSLRKTWAFSIWHNAEDKSKALVMLQQCLAHSDSMTTMRYIGILDSEKKDMYESIELGLNLI